VEKGGFWRKELSNPTTKTGQKKKKKGKKMKEQILWGEQKEKRAYELEKKQGERHGEGSIEHRKEKKGKRGGQKLLREGHDGPGKKTG